MTTTLNYIKEHQQRFLDELFNFLSIPSISADSTYRDSVHEAANWLVHQCRKLGIENVQLFPTAGYPVVFASIEVSPSKPTLLIYGHYDVQPPDPLDLWDHPPFEPVVKDGKIYARGASDDKGQMYMHIKALEVLMSQGELPCNVKILIEGEEEVGSDNLELFVRDHQELLASDIVLISDTSMIANDIPSITVGVRGISYVEVQIEGPNRDLHSGVYGGAVGNPVNILCNMIASLVDEQGKITIPGFYDEVIELNNEERAAIRKKPFDLEAFNRELGVEGSMGEEGYSPVERTAIRPTLDVNGIWGGYIGEGAKTVLPSKAHAKISMRLVPNQRSEHITELFASHFTSIAPKGIKVKVTPHHGGEAAVLSTHSTGYQAAANAMKATFGKDPIPTREGGSIPIVAMFQQVLGIDTILMGFGLDSDAIHSPNEHYGVFNYLKGIETIVQFHQNYADLSS